MTPIKQTLSVIITTIVIICFPVKSAAETTSDTQRLSFDMTFTSSDSYEIGLGYHYMPNRFIAVGGYIGFWGRASAGNIDTIEYYDDDFIGSLVYSALSGLSISGGYIRPVITFTTPTLFTVWDTDIKIEAEPGITIATQSTQELSEWAANEQESNYYSYKTDICTWKIRAGLAAQKDAFSFRLGYSLSNFDINRTIHHGLNGIYFTKGLVHGFYINIGLSF